MVMEAVLADLEPEKRSGIPEGRLLTSYITGLWGFPGSFWYQET